MIAKKPRPLVAKLLHRPTFYAANALAIIRKAKPKPDWRKYTELAKARSELQLEEFHAIHATKNNTTESQSVRINSKKSQNQNTELIGDGVHQPPAIGQVLSPNYMQLQTRKFEKVRAQQLDTLTKLPRVRLKRSVMVSMGER